MKWNYWGLILSCWLFLEANKSGGKSILPHSLCWWVGDCHAQQLAAQRRETQKFLRTLLFSLIHLPGGTWWLSKWSLKSLVVTPTFFPGGPSGGYSVVLPAIVLHLADTLGQSFYPGELRALVQGKHYHTRSFPACQRAQCWHQQACPRQPRWLQPTALAGQEPAAPPTPWEAHGEGGQCCNCGVAGRSAGRSCLTKTTSPKKSGHI